MNGDISRQTFDPAKRYSAVVMQQGRVQLDADWNEQQAIHAHRLESAMSDVVGATGALKDLAGRDGFRVFASGGALWAGRGAFYVDGVRCELGADLRLDQQPHLDGTAFNGAPAWPPAPGTYVVYLDVWRRHVSALEDPAIRETALGGPDTATRLQTLWRVRHLAVPAGTTCASALPLFQNFARRGPPATRPGRLAARSSAAAAGSNPCVLPPEAGFRGLENQLYRVEIHRGGPLGTARFKWSRENASVATRVVSVTDDPNVGLLLQVDGLGHDETLGFANDDWVEFVDDDVELSGAPRVLMQIDQVQPHASAILFKQGTAVPAVNPARNPRLRRWDHTATSNEGVVTAAGWTALEHGVEVRFEEGVFHPGDHWLIPARTATTGGGGSVEWPAAGGAPAPRDPHGTTHHLAPLAVLTVAAGNLFSVADCRRRFPALTEITAADVRYDNAPCVLPGLPGATTVQAALGALCARDEGYGIVVVPGTGWQQSLLTRLEPLAATGAYVRFRTGDFPTAQPVVLAGTGHLTVEGGGLATRLRATGSECALRFEGWASVTVRDLFAEAQTVGEGDDLRGVLAFAECGQVTVEDVTVRGAGGTRRAASCVSVTNLKESAATAVRVRGCRLEAGNAQVGLLVVNATRVQVEDNEIRGPDGPAVPLTASQLSDPEYLRWLERVLVNRLYRPDQTPVATNDRASVTVLNQRMDFHTIPTLVTAWQTVANDALQLGPTPDLATYDRRYAWLRRVISAVIADPKRRAAYSGLNAYVATLSSQNLPAASQGVVVAGTIAREVRVVNNTLSRVGQGVHVALGPRPTNQLLRPGNVAVTGNSVEGWASPASPWERFGIYVGGGDTVRVDRNNLVLSRPLGVPSVRVEGVRLRGSMGRVATVRENQLSGYTVAVAAYVPGGAPVPRRWIIADNITVGAQHSVVDAGGFFDKTGNVP